MNRSILPAAELLLRSCQTDLMTLIIMETVMNSWNCVSVGAQVKIDGGTMIASKTI